MSNRVTIQDIADELGLSRNTVSKAMNNAGLISEATKINILKKAKEMGYKQFTYISLPDEEPAAPPAAVPDTKKSEIVVLTGRYIGENHFAASMIDCLQTEMASIGYTTSLRKLLPNELSERRLSLPDPSRIAGMICFEIFDPEYAQSLKSLDIPLLFVDAPVTLYSSRIGADPLIMENRTSTTEVIRHMIEKGKKSIGFVGDYHNCQSFFERYSTLLECVHWGITNPVPFSICGIRNIDFENGICSQQEYIKKKLREMKQLPEAFFCANDSIAEILLLELDRFGLCVPKDIYVAGFDDSPIASKLSPSLTTVHIHGHEMGYSAARMLQSRIQQPDRENLTCYIDSKPVYRASTED